MQTIRSLAKQMEAVFDAIDQEVARYAADTGLACPNGCGACCEAQDIAITLLDALPMALDWLDQGVAEAMAARLAEAHAAGCPVFEGTGDGRGRCGRYAKRPSLCRAFGFAGVRRKDGLPVLTLCRLHKQQRTHVPAHVPPPLYEKFSRQLQGIHPQYGTELLPIREAMRQALEKVLLAARIAAVSQSAENT